MIIFVAILLGGLVSSLYALSTSLQALEARRSKASSALRSSLVGSLARRPLWLAGTAAGLVAWPIQAVALSLASVAVVQPALGLGLIVLLVLGVTILHERIGRREVVSAAAIAAAIAVLGWAAPPESARINGYGQVVVAAMLALAAAGPYLLRAGGGAGGLPTSVAAGFAWAAVGLATVLIDTSIANRHWLWGLAWGGGVAAASWAGLLAEMTALQTWPATRAIPVVFALEMAVPAALAPILTFVEPVHLLSFGAALAVSVAAAVALGSSRAVAHVAHPLTEP